MSILQRVHLYPFRTQKLSSAMPTILAWRRAGKIGRCEHSGKTAEGRRFPDTKEVRVHIAEGPPVSIPNTEVKLCHADNTCLETDWEDRSMRTPGNGRRATQRSCVAYPYALIKEEKEKFKQEVDKVRPLPVTYYESDAFFTSLKAFAGFKYEKIIGCYIIRNRENGKCYVGQSKDVLRRLQQHFKGTEPTNIIFAEDYYTSSYSNKEDLFEVRIVRCKTKDELDETEKSLIEEYDAWTSGYNRTSGNS